MDDDVLEHFEAVHGIQKTIVEWNKKQSSLLALLTVWNLALTLALVYLWLYA